MDSRDWTLICELAGNARLPYQALARRLNVSSNTVKNRINRLRKNGVIRGFAILVSMEVLEAEHVSGVISTDGTEKVIDFMRRVSNNHAVCEIYRTGDMRYEYWAMVSGAADTLGLKKHLEAIKGAIDVEIRPIIFHFPNKPPNFYLNTRGRKVDFTQHQLRVLRCLYQDARMPVSKIAVGTGFTPRRVRKILQELQEGGGIHSTISYNIFALGDMEYRLKFRFDDSITTGQEIIMDLYHKFTNEFWWSSITTNEPIVDVGFVIDRPGRGVPILQNLKKESFIESIEDYVSYPRVVGNVSPLRSKLEEILIESGLLAESDIIRRSRQVAQKN